MTNLLGGALAGATNGIAEVKQQPITTTPQATQTTQIAQTQDTKQPTKFVTKNELRSMIEKGQATGVEPKAVLQGFKDRGYEIEGYTEHSMDIARQSMKKTKKAGLLTNIIGGVGTSTTSLGATAADLTIKGLEKTSLPKKLEQFGKQSGRADRLNKRSLEKFGVPFSDSKTNYSKFDIGQNEDSKAFKASKFIADAIQTAADTQLLTSAIKETAKGVELASGMSSGLRNVFSKMGLSEGAIEKATKITTQVLKNAGEGALDLSIFNTIAEKELPNFKTIAAGGAFGAAFPLLAAPLKKAGSGLYKMFIPKTETEIDMLLKSKAGLGSKPFTAGDTALKNKMFGTKSSLGAKALKKQNKLWNDTIFPALSSAKDRITKNELLKGPMEFLDSIVIPSEKRKYNKVFKQLVNDLPDDMSLVEAQNLKKSIDDVTSNKILAGERGGIEKTFNNKVANQIRSSIREKLGPKIGDAYRDFSNLYTVVKLGKNSLKTGAGAGAIESAITKGSSLGIIGHLLGQVATPAGTAVGLIANELGDMVGSDGVRRVANMLSSKSNK